MWKTWHTVVCWLAVPVLGLVAWLFQGFGFDVLQQLRQLERVPRSQIISVIEGEVNLEGKASSLGSSLRAPHTGTECLYYLYILEEERTDSDGDSYWAEIRRETRRADIISLEDDSGEIQVETAGAEFSLESDVHTTGSHRHTEYRLEPGDTVFVFGHASKLAGREVVEFSSPGQYTPLISTFGEKGERRDMAAASLWWSFGALSMASFAVMFFAWAIRVHRLLVFLTMVSLVQGAGLVYLGLKMLRLDLESSHARVLRQQERAHEEIRGLLERGGISWDGDWADEAVFNESALRAPLGGDDFKRVQGIYGDVAAGITRFNAVGSRFPERHLAPAWGVGALPEMPLAQAFAPGFGQQKAIVEVPISFWQTVLMLGLGVPTAVGFAWIGFVLVKQKRFIENIPTSLSTGLAYGPAEVKGVAREDGSLFKGPLSGEACFYYHYVVQEKRGSGKNATWVTIVDDRKGDRFLCEDAEGTVPVSLGDAEIHTRHKHKNWEFNRIYTEENLQPGDAMYVLGPALVDERTGDRLMFVRDDSSFPFFVANLSEEQMMTRKGRRGLGLLNLGLNGFVLTALAGFGATASYAPTDYLLAAFIAPIFLAICFIILMYNDLQFVRHRVRRAWANIDVSLKKRADLIPGLEAVVKGFLKHEKGLQEDVAQLRASFKKGRDWDPASASKLLAAETAVTSRLLAAGEDYPDLKGDQAAAKLFKQVVTMENEVALMRQGYNDSVERHNTRIQSLPEVILAKLFGFQPEQPLEAEVNVRAVPKVELPARKPARKKKKKSSRKPPKKS